MKKYIILLLALCSMSACDYEAVNTNLTVSPMGN